MRLTLILALSLIFSPCESLSAECRKALYITSDWVSKPFDENEYSEFKNGVLQTGIKDLYLLTRRDTKFIRTTTQEFLQLQKEGVRIYSFISRRNICQDKITASCVDLTDSATRQQIVDEVKEFWASGFHGVQLDLEPLPRYDGVQQALVILLQEINGAKVKDYPDQVLSLASAALEPQGEGAKFVSNPKKPDSPPPYFWSRDFYAKIITLIDQIVVMDYDYALTSAPDYEGFTQWQTSQILAIKEELHSQHKNMPEIIMGLPAFQVGRDALHDPKVENLQSGKNGVLKALGNDICPEGFGVAVFSDLFTLPKAQQWKIFDKFPEFK
jgi:hypothetical protein